MPTAASGARIRDKVGLRRSQSTRRTRPCACAMSCARAAASVDFPSLGSVDVKPITLHDPAAIFKSTASLIERIASEKLDKGELTTVQNTSASRPWLFGYFHCRRRNTLCDGRFVCLPFNNGTTAMQGTCSAASSCLAVRKTRSIISRSIARPKPKPIPPMMLNARMSKGFGLTCY